MSHPFILLSMSQLNKHGFLSSIFHPFVDGLFGPILEGPPNVDTPVLTVKTDMKYTMQAEGMLTNQYIEDHFLLDGPQFPCQFQDDTTLG